MSIELAAAPLEAWIPGRLPVIASALLRSVRPLAGPSARLWADIDTPHDVEPACSTVPSTPLPISFSEEDLARACAAAALASAERQRSSLAAEAARAEILAMERLTRELALAHDGWQRCLEGTAAALSRTLAVAVEATGVLRQGQPERLEALLRATFAETLRAPELQVLVDPSLLATAQRVMPAAAAAAGFAGRVAVSASSAPGGPSVRIDWGDGWAEADLGRVERQLIEHLTASDILASAPSASTPSIPEE